ncbi:MAG TPA: ABC transporter ATP-binding protein [Acidimicrobiales bacterium]|nr:ABC transporter ATP-binding protein [Acidimicrobiales bacterium]
MLLELQGVTTHYGQLRILEDLDLAVGEGELVCLLGGNASGKSTTLMTILGLVRPTKGEVLIDSEVVTTCSVAERIRRGLAIVPENRRLFRDMTVLENLELGAVSRGRADITADLETVFDIFPLLGRRRGQVAGTMSGGEQQMVAIGRALMARPRLLLMDEPSMGLAPALVRQSFETIAGVNARGVAVLIVEQNATMALSIAARGYVLAMGQVVLEGPAGELLGNETLRRAYLGQ